MKSDIVALHAFKHPTGWELRCPKCSNHHTVKESIDSHADARKKYPTATPMTAQSLRDEVCWYHPTSLMVLKPIKPNLVDAFFLMYAVIFRR